MRRIYCVPYTSVQRLMADEGVRSILSQQHRWGRRQLLQQAAQLMPKLKRSVNSSTIMRSCSSWRRSLVKSFRHGRGWKGSLGGLEGGSMGQNETRGISERNTV